MKLIEFLVSKISYFRSNKSYAVVLKEINGDRRLPIMLGSYEAQAIAIAMESIDTQRPLTHDLLINVLQGLGLSLKNVTINDTIKPNVIIQPKSIIGFIPLKTNDKKAQIVVKTV